MKLTPEDKMVLTGLVAAELRTMTQARDELRLKKTGLATLLDRQIAHLDGLLARFEKDMEL